jgi:hypothetical protein
MVCPSVVGPWPHSDQECSNWRVSARAGFPYLVTPEHTRQARCILGQGLLVAPEQKVVVDSEDGRARVLASPSVTHPYLGL